ncbi:hypothetical protein BC833DRAFT_250122 [Globomyces pollinis-pini]|nr:hypothetical protein BC833DRAFT_250122 [Globomyces pollinis-pini]
MELWKYSYFNRPPHNIFLVTGDRDFSKVLSFLESVQYNVVLIHSPVISEVLRHSVSETIPWLELCGTSMPLIKNSAESQTASQTSPGSVDLEPFERQNIDNKKLSYRTSNEDYQAKSVVEVIKKPTRNVSDKYGDLTRQNSKDSIRQFDDLRKYFVETQQTSALLSIIGEYPVTQGVYSRHGFKTMKEYIDAAVEKRVVALSRNQSNHMVVTLNSVKSQSVKEDFKLLIQVLNEAPRQTLSIREIGIHPITRGIFRNYGYPSMKAYLDSAEHSGVIKVMEILGNGNMVVRLCRRFVPSILLHSNVTKMISEKNLLQPLVLVLAPK